MRKDFDICGESRGFESEMSRDLESRQAELWTRAPTAKGFCDDLRLSRTAIPSIAHAPWSRIPMTAGKIRTTSGCVHGLSNPRPSLYHAFSPLPNVVICLVSLLARRTTPVAGLALVREYSPAIISSRQYSTDNIHAPIGSYLIMLMGFVFRGRRMVMVNPVMAMDTSWTAMMRGFLAVDVRGANG